MKYFFKYELIEVLVFTKKTDPAGTQPSDEPTKRRSKKKVQLKCNCVDGKIANFKRDSFLRSFILSAPLGFQTLLCIGK